MARLPKAFLRSACWSPTPLPQSNCNAPGSGSHTRTSLHATAPAASPGVHRRRIESAVEHFVDIDQMQDQAAAARIADDGIDVLVDLKCYTHQARTGILTFRAAPIQAQFLG